MQIVGIELLLVVHGIVEIDRDDVPLAVAEHNARQPRDQCECRLLTELAELVDLLPACSGTGAER